MFILRPLIALPFVLPTAFAFTQLLSAGVSKFQEPLLASNTGLSLSAENYFVIGPARSSFKFTVPEPTAPGRFTSPSRAGYLDFAHGDVAGLYGLKWEDDSTAGAGTKFSASGCDCGGNCGGACVKYEGHGPGQWVVDERVAGTEEWKVGYWNGTGTKPEGLTPIILWRSERR